MRRQLLFARRALSLARRNQASAKIARAVLRLPEFRRARRIMAYWPADSEVDTWPILRSAFAAGKEVLLPRVAGRRVRPTPWAPGRQLRLSRFGIPEPVPSAGRRGNGRIDLAIIPGLGFDHRGNRLGRGEGFYDRFIPGFSGKVCAIAFDAQLRRRLPVGRRDAAVSLLVTEKRIYRFRRRPARTAR